MQCHSSHTHKITALTHNVTALTHNVTAVTHKITAFMHNITAVTQDHSNHAHSHSSHLHSVTALTWTVSHHVHSVTAPTYSFTALRLCLRSYTVTTFPYSERCLYFFWDQESCFLCTNALTLSLPLLMWMCPQITDYIMPLNYPLFKLESSVPTVPRACFALSCHDSLASNLGPCASVFLFLLMTSPLKTVPSFKLIC